MVGVLPQDTLHAVRICLPRREGFGLVFRENTFPENVSSRIKLPENVLSRRHLQMSSQQTHFYRREPCLCVVLPLQSDPGALGKSSRGNFSSLTESLYKR